MAELRLRQLWNVELTTPELRLILKALGGRLSTEHDELQAIELGDFLTKLRANQLTQLGVTGAQLNEALQISSHD